MHLKQNKTTKTYTNTVMMSIHPQKMDKKHNGIYDTQLDSISYDLDVDDQNLKCKLYYIKKIYEFTSLSL